MCKNLFLATVRNKTRISKGTQNGIIEILVNEIRVDSKGLLTYYLYHLKIISLRNINRRELYSYYV